MSYLIKYHKMYKIIQKKCVGCGNVFDGNKVRSYCSHKCFLDQSSTFKAKTFRKNNLPWNKEMRGESSHSFGNKFALGNKLSEETKRNIGINGFHYGMSGKKHSEETRLKMSESRKGQKSYLWQGGKTSLNFSIRASYVYQALRRKVLIRDDFICQSCSKKGGALHVNHKKPFAQILKENKVDSLAKAISCLELWDENNLETLCVDCHKLTDSYLNRWHKHTSQPNELQAPQGELSNNLATVT